MQSIMKNKKKTLNSSWESEPALVANLVQAKKKKKEFDSFFSLVSLIDKTGEWNLMIINSEMKETLHFPY